jgi:hypothetical protein
MTWSRISMGSDGCHCGAYMLACGDRCHCGAYMHFCRLVGRNLVWLIFKMECKKAKECS